MTKPPFILTIAGGGSTYTPGIVKKSDGTSCGFPAGRDSFV